MPGRNELEVSSPRTLPQSFHESRIGIGRATTVECPDFLSRSALAGDLSEPFLNGKNARRPQNSRPAYGKADLRFLGLHPRTAQVAFRADTSETATRVLKEVRRLEEPRSTRL